MFDENKLLGMLLTFAPRVNFVKFVQFRKTFASKVEIFPLIVICVKPLQREKAEEPIEFTPSGIVIEVKLLQPEKAEFPIEVNLLGRVIEVKPLQLQNA